jgi:hypothetical protein
VDDKTLKPFLSKITNSAVKQQMNWA